MSSRDFCKVKQIRFRIKIGWEEISSLADLREHFCFDDVAEYWKDGTLQNWLDHLPDKDDKLKLGVAPEGKTDKEIFEILNKTFFPASTSLSETLKEQFQQFRKNKNLPSQNPEIIALIIDDIGDKELVKEIISQLEPEKRKKLRELAPKKFFQIPATASLDGNFLQVLHDSTRCSDTLADAIRAALGCDDSGAGHHIYNTLLDAWLKSASVSREDKHCFESYEDTLNAHKKFTSDIYRALQKDLKTTSASPGDDLAAYVIAALKNENDATVLKTKFESSEFEYSLPEPPEINCDITEFACGIFRILFPKTRPQVSAS